MKKSRIETYVKTKEISYEDFLNVKLLPEYDTSYKERTDYDNVIMEAIRKIDNITKYSNETCSYIEKDSMGDAKSSINDVISEIYDMTTPLYDLESYIYSLHQTINSYKEKIMDMLEKEKLDLVKHTNITEDEYTIIQRLKYIEEIYKD